MTLENHDELTEEVIGAAIEVHRHLGPGLLESAYEECLSYELQQRGLTLERQIPLPVVYKGIQLNCGYRLDMVVNGELILEIKAVEKLLPVHTAQLVTYLRLRNLTRGLIINFGGAMLIDGVRRVSNNLARPTEPPASAT